MRMILFCKYYFIESNYEETKLISNVVSARHIRNIPKNYSKLKKNLRSEQKIKINKILENHQVKIKADKAAEQFIKNLDSKLNKKSKSNQRKLNNISENKYSRSPKFNLRPNMKKEFSSKSEKKVSKLGKKKKKSIFKQKIKESGVEEFEQILKNFSLYSRFQENKNKIAEISLSTINPSVFQETNSLANRTSKMIDNFKFNNSIHVTMPKVKTLTKEIIPKKEMVDKSVMTDKIEPRVITIVKKVSENSITNSSLEELSENIPQKFDHLYKKMCNKIKNYSKKNGNLERQLRNRNKDYLYALKEIEKVKLQNE